jgi:predicted phage terminase large subunit-like protein
MTSLSGLSDRALVDQAARELLRRRYARAELASYANAIDVPGRPASDNEDEWLFHPIETSIAAHHLLFLDTFQDLVEGKERQAMIFAPPGSAKSTYCSVVGPTWFMGKFPERRTILASYASDIARKQGRRARQIVRSEKFSSTFKCEISNDTSAADEWALTNGSEFMAGGIRSGITGNRAHGLIIDDPVKGRDEADSEAIRKKTREAYEDDLATRLVPGAFTLIITTRWSHGDLAGSILPEGWNGESGRILCRDGLMWKIVCLPAIADRRDDPLGRQIGEPLWKEWFKDGHFDRYRKNTRTWSALFQQKPTADEGDYFRKDWFHEYEKAPPRSTMKIYGASDYAVTEDGGDYTVHIVVGIDPQGRMWLLDVWRKQSLSDEWVEAFCDLVLKWKPNRWAEEAGQINAGVGPFMIKRMRERHAHVWRKQFPSKHDKAVRARSIQGRMATDGLMVPKGAEWLAAFIAELIGFPAGVNDDQVDALGLIGQLLDVISAGRDEEEQKPKPKELAYEAQSDGRIVANMSLNDQIQAHIKRRTAR